MGKGLHPLHPHSSVEGYMAKLGSFVRTWRRRYFVLDPRSRCLHYYKSAVDVAELGNVQLARAVVVRGGDEQVGWPGGWGVGREGEVGTGLPRDLAFLLRLTGWPLACVVLELYFVFLSLSSLGADFPFALCSVFFFVFVFFLFCFFFFFFLLPHALTLWVCLGFRDHFWFLVLLLLLLFFWFFLFFVFFSVAHIA
jgi:hypothetical protein